MRIYESETNKCKKKLMLEPKEFEQGIEYALANGCDGLQIDTWNIDDVVMDFKLFEKVANQIVFLSFMNVNTANVANILLPASGFAYRLRSFFISPKYWNFLQ